MDNSDLSFQESKSIQQFKNDLNCSSIDIIRNPNTNNIFFATDTGLTGKVTKKIDNLDDSELQMSYVKDDAGEEYWMICKKNTNNVVRTL